VPDGGANCGQLPCRIARRLAAHCRADDLPDLLRHRQAVSVCGLAELGELPLLEQHL
jgi:hypothetical protein